MALVIPQGFAQFVVQLTHESLARPMSVTWGATVDLSAESADDWVNFHQGQFVIAWAGAIDTQVVIGPTTGTFGTDGPDPVVVVSSSTPVGGSGDYDTPPVNTAALIKKRTALGGRKNRGRMFLPSSIPESSVNDVGVISSGHLSNLQSRADNWLEAIQTGAGGAFATGNMVVLHSEDAVTAGLPAPTPVTSLVVDQLVATQRRRLRR